MKKEFRWLNYTVPILLHIVVCLFSYVFISELSLTIDLIMFYSGLSILLILVFANNSEKRSFNTQKLKYNIAFPLFSMYIGCIFLILIFLYPSSKFFGLLLIVIGVFSASLSGEVETLSNDPDSLVNSGNKRILLFTVFTVSLSIITVGVWIFYTGEWEWYIL